MTNIWHPLFNDLFMTIVKRQL